MMVHEKKHNYDSEDGYPVSGNYDLEVAPAGAEHGVQDAVFGELGQDGPNYRAVSEQRVP